MAATFFGLFILAGLLLGGLLLTTLLALNAKTTGGRVAVIVIGLSILLGVPLFLIAMLMSVRVASSETQPATRSDRWEVSESERVSLPNASSRGTAMESESGDVPSPPPPVMAPRDPAGQRARPASAWATTQTESFQANVYPSYASAIDSLVANLRETLAERKVLARDENNNIIDPEAIVVTANGSTVAPLLDDAAAKVAKQFPGVNVVGGGNAPPQSIENQLSIHFDVNNTFELSAPWSRDQRITNGSLNCSVAGRHGKTSFPCFVTEKPWVESFDRFVSMNPRRKLIVGYSGEFQSSESEAREAALEDAVRQATMNLSGRSYALIDQRHVVDRFAQRLTRPYGEVWREAVLVEVPDADAVAAAEAAVGESFQLAARRQIAAWGAIAVLLIATVLICALLNWVTQGYYRGRIVIGLIGMVAVSSLLMLVFVS